MLISSQSKSSGLGHDSPERSWWLEAHSLGPLHISSAVILEMTDAQRWKTLAPDQPPELPLVILTARDFLEKSCFLPPMWL